MIGGGAPAAQLARNFFMKIKITREDILHYDTFDVQHNFLTRAIKRACHQRVVLSETCFAVLRGDRMTVYTVPQSAIDTLYSFVDGYRVKPYTFEVEPLFTIS